MRSLAGLIDVVVFLLGTLGVVIATVAATAAYMWVRGDRDRSDADSDPDASEASPTFLQPRWQQAALRVATYDLAIVSRNWRSPGYRLLGLRRIDARGGPVTARSALVGTTFHHLRESLTSPLVRSRVDRERASLTAIQAQMKELERKHADDPDALKKATKQLYQANHVNPLRTCAWPLLLGLLTQLVLNGWSRRGQTLQDRLTGTVVVVDPGPDAPGWLRRCRRAALRHAGSPAIRLAELRSPTRIGVRSRKADQAWVK
jgi:hypothetical protein